MCIPECPKELHTCRREAKLRRRNRRSKADPRAGRPRSKSQLFTRFLVLRFRIFIFPSVFSKMPGSRALIIKAVPNNENHSEREMKSSPDSGAGCFGSRKSREIELRSFSPVSFCHLGRMPDLSFNGGFGQKFGQEIANLIVILRHT